MPLSKVPHTNPVTPQPSVSPDAHGLHHRPRDEDLASPAAKRASAGTSPEGLTASAPASSTAPQTPAPRQRDALPRPQPMAQPGAAMQAAAVRTAAPGDAPMAPPATRTMTADTARRILADVVQQFRLDLHGAGDTDPARNSQLQHLQVLERRASGQLERLASNLDTLYGGHQDVPAALQKLLQVFIAGGLERPAELRDLDTRRQSDPNWFGSNKSIASSLYVDVHSGNLAKLEKDLGLFKLLNISMLHFMPTIYKTPEKDNDGGYAISDFRALNPAVGTMDELRSLFSTMRKSGISPIMDVTINHVSDEHEWVRAAKAGDPEKMDFFHLVDEAQKNDYDRHVKFTFPQIRPSNFTWDKDIGRYAWTTFMSSQWDVNYNNPKLLAAMAGEMMFLLNQGAEMLRLDAVPFVWKEPGTPCKDMPKTQNLLGIFNAMNKIAAPGAALLSEAITMPESVRQYLGPDKCQMAYNATSQSYLWDALSHEDASNLAEVLRRHGNVPEGTAFLNILRTHDDSIFDFDPKTNEALGIDPAKRQAELSKFFFDGRGYAKGIPFREDTSPTARALVNGTTASLAGIEKALEAGSQADVDTAIQRVKLLKSVLLSLPGTPMINLSGGEDRGQINDYTFMDDAIKKLDTRWANRVPRDIDLGSKSDLEVKAMETVFNDTVALNRIRTQQMPAFGTGPMQVIDTGAAAVLGFTRKNHEQSVLVLANFSANEQVVRAENLQDHRPAAVMADTIDPQSNPALTHEQGIKLAPYQCMWLVPAGGHAEQPPHTQAGTP